MQSNNLRKKILLCFDTIKLQILPLITFTLIFFLAFIPRILDLGTGLTCDEVDWLKNAPDFLNAVTHFEFIKTFIFVHPGVTTMWLSGIFMKLFVLPDMTFPQILTIARFPIALVTSLGILTMYFFLKILFNNKIAILACVLIALDPFLIAHSRLIHLDALLTTFMTLSFLSLLVYLIHREKVIYLYLSGIFLGFSILTKLPAYNLLPVIFFILVIWQLATYYQANQNRKTALTSLGSQIFSDILKPFFFILLIAGAVFVLLWPAMWVQPFLIGRALLFGASYWLQTPHYAGFFLGLPEPPTSTYGLIFYPVEILIRATPLTLVFSLFCILYLFNNFRKTKFSNENLVIISFITFIFIFTLVMTIGEKKFDRYLLPVFPFIDCIAAIGVYYCYSIIGERLGNTTYSSKINKNIIFQIFLFLVICSQILLIVPIAPYYLSYTNPGVFGGPKNAPNVTLIGWGEGNDLAAEYLNNKPSAENITVAAQYRGFAEYFKGTTVPFNDVASSDYIVFYVCAVQRHFNEDLWNAYKNETPEKKITLNSIDYCWIYKTNASTAETS